MHILVVDDEQTILYVLQTFLGECGHRVTTRSTVEDALTVMGEDQIDLVITDVKMPYRDGFDLFREIRRDSPNLPVIAITGYYDENEGEITKKLGVQHLMHKPFSLDDLARAIEDLTGGQPCRQEAK